MASLQARHSRGCRLYPWTPIAKATAANGCTCKTPPPLYHVVYRGTQGKEKGKLVRKPVGHNREQATRALKVFHGEEAQDKYDVFKVEKQIAFDVFADRWLAAVTGKPTTRYAYSVSIEYAKRTFGMMNVRAIGAADVTRFLGTIRDASAEHDRVVSDATLSKHLRHLSACLGAAVSEGLADTNAVAKLHKTARPKVAKKRPAYFTNDELARLWPAVEHRPVYFYFFKAAYATGLRFGELAALVWNDVDLLNKEIHVARAYSYGYGEDTTKSGEPRTVDLTPPARELLEAWFKVAGDDGGLIFPSETGGYLDPSYSRRVLYGALATAGVSRVGERGRARTLHSFRHSFARTALEAGNELQWVQRQLGHASIVITADTYGSWQRTAEKAQAERLAGAFAL